MTKTTQLSLDVFLLPFAAHPFSSSSAAGHIHIVVILLLLSLLSLDNSTNKRQTHKNNEKKTKIKINSNKCTYLQSILFFVFVFCKNKSYLFTFLNGLYILSHRFGFGILADACLLVCLSMCMCVLHVCLSEVHVCVCVVLFTVPSYI